MVEASNSELDYTARLKDLKLPRMILKGCTQCRGDMFYERDSWGTYYLCLQGGHLYDLDTPYGISLVLTYGERIAKT